MSRTVETDAIVLRSIRYAEADRILHLYTPGFGRLGAIAKGARRTKSKFGARLEPFTRVELVLRAGRGDLLSVSSVQTVAAHSRLRTSADALDWSARACDAVARLFDGSDPHPEAYNLLANGLAMVDRDPSLAIKATQVTFRLKLLVAAGLRPHLSSCAGCGATERLAGFSGAAGGVVCEDCSDGAFPLGREGWEWLVASLGSPLSEAGTPGTTALRQAERSINETVEHHANIRLRPASAR